MSNLTGTKMRKKLRYKIEDLAFIELIDPEMQLEQQILDVELRRKKPNPFRDPPAKPSKNAKRSGLKMNVFSTLKTFLSRNAGSKDFP